MCDLREFQLIQTMVTTGLKSPAENFYRIQWRSKLAEFEDSGPPVIADKTEAEKLCQALNAWRPELHHWVELGFGK